MLTTHRVCIGDARELPGVAESSVQLIVTSPPYPMIAMWDGLFAELSPGSAETMEAGRGFEAFEAMHQVLDAAWAAGVRALAPGGFFCVNIGDATRSVGGELALYPNHARVVSAMLRLGMTPLPDILWRKPTNAPNKFMGSGMLPAGAYVTYEHEYVLIFRKGGKRRFDAAGQRLRAQSAYFWEERNLWFSDLWTDLRGTAQGLGGARERSGAFPLELPARLIAMFSLYGDLVLDPFVGTGTTLAAALALGRSSVGVERDAGLAGEVRAALPGAAEPGRRRARGRLAAHLRFVGARQAEGKALGHRSAVYGFPVMTRQEVALALQEPRSAVEREGVVYAEHALAPIPGPEGAAGQLALGW